MSIVTIYFAGRRPCCECGSTSSVRGWISRTDEIVCMSRRACEKRQLATWRKRHPECYALKHRPVPGGFCAACKPDWARRVAHVGKGRAGR